MRQVKTKRMNRIVVAVALMLSLVGVGNLSAGRTVSASTTFTVTTKADSGAGSLRQAILDANANPGADRIEFDGEVFADPDTIDLTSKWSVPHDNSALTIFDDVTIEGPGADVLTVRRSYCRRHGGHAGLHCDCARDGRNFGPLPSATATLLGASLTKGARLT